MACDLPCMSYMALYIISMHIVNSNSRNSGSSSSHHWKLNLSTGKVQPAKAETGSSVNSNKHNSSDSSVNHNKQDSDKNTDSSFEDNVWEILTNKVVKADGEWVVTSPDSDYSDVLEVHDQSKDCHCDKNVYSANLQLRHSDGCSYSGCSMKSAQHKSSKGKKPKTKTDNQNSKTFKPLSCGEKVNSTQYDHLRGISDRHLLLHVPEPDVAMVFQSNGKSSEVDMTQLEQKLRKAKQDIERTGPGQREKSAQVYNLIGNFWRIKGNTQNSIECFRKALNISPEDPDILLNLARVLFNLQYLDDAIFLAQRSLHLQPKGQNSWLQHYTLGEVLKSLGQHQEAAAHFRQALELNPDFQPAKSHLRDLDSSPSPSVTHLTLLIILFLVVGVLFGVVTSIETNFQDSADGSKTQQRHFNRAMAMRSIKLGINPRMCRLRKINS
ncbi:unnamed protein product [Candidula unifasciata]|uniref:Tetratricopeptide repeat protein 17 n=1 Tax=Candidula unifasciata TaxID=100452 RepID=A0A8S3ZKG5_9EUPU|nr:unnamed protein product [Candidula unifasciata]